MKLPIFARLFVGIVFVILWATFLVCPFVLYNEFGGQNWLAISMFHSYLFVFYPLFGLVALIAFYRPAAVFAHFYWWHVPYGRIRFLVGFAVVIGLSYFFSAKLLDQQPRGVWEMKSAVAAAAAGTAANCTETGRGCNSGELLNRMLAVKAASMDGRRMGMLPYARNCYPDKLMEPTAESLKQRQCFVTADRKNAKDCCAEQMKFRDLVRAEFQDWHLKSQTGIWHAYLLPFKSFFVMIMIIIAVLLVFWQKRIHEHYGSLVPKMERGLLIGAIAMLFWPLMEYAYGQSSGVLFGNWEAGFNLLTSIVVLPWAVLIGVYFLRSRGFGILTQIGSVMGAAFAALRYSEVTGFAERFVGSGAGQQELTIMAALALIAIIIVLFPSTVLSIAGAGAKDAPNTAATIAAGRNPPDGGPG